MAAGGSLPTCTGAGQRVFGEKKYLSLLHQIDRVQSPPPQTGIYYILLKLFKIPTFSQIERIKLIIIIIYGNYHVNVQGGGRVSNCIPLLQNIYAAVMG